MRVVVAIALLSGCALYVGPEPEPAPVDDDVGTCDGELHPACAEACSFACEWPVECRDGRTAVYDPTRVPCWEWTDTCAPVEIIECAAGCDVDDSFWEAASGRIDQRRVCAEYPTARVGDPCAFEYDCRPTRLEVQADGSLHQTYLSCGLTACEEINDPPAVEGYLAPCEITAAIPSGSSGVHRGCLYVDATDGCLYTGASSRRCDGDWECPQGSSCDSSLAILEPQGDERGGRCRPGLRGTPLPLAALTAARCK